MSSAPSRVGTGIDGSPVDPAQVNGLLIEADVRAREILMEIHPADAVAMVRAWGQVAGSAANVWRSLPADDHHRDGAGDLTMARLQAMAEGFQVTAVTRGWPRPGRADERLLAVADSFERAAEAMGGRPAPGQQACTSELDGARARVMHTLYVGAHGVCVAMRGHIRKTEAAAARATKRNLKLDPYLRSLERAHEVVDRMEAFGHLAGSSVHDHARATPAPTQRAAKVGPWERLHQAVAAWDIQVHRTLTAAPAPQNLLLAARTQAVLTTATIVILDAGARTGHVDRGAYDQRLVPALTASQSAWSQVAGRWGDLTPVASQPCQDLLRAENQVRTAIREVTRDTAGWAPAPVIAERIDIGQTARHLQRALSGAADVAHLVREIAATDRKLTGPARAVLQRAHSDARTTGHYTADGSAWVAAADVHANRMVRLPDVVRWGLSTASNNVVRAATAAMSAAACLDSPGSMTRGAAENPLVTVRRTQQPAIHLAPLPSCARPHR